VVHQVRQTVILGHGGKQGSSKTLVAGSTIDAVTAAKAPGFISSIDSAAPVKAPEVPVSKEINSAKASAAPTTSEPPKSESAVVKPQDKGAVRKKAQKPGSPQPLPGTRNEVKAMSDADSRQLSRDLGIEFADDETTDVIQDRIVKELGLS
jgi:hypothetical protein